MLVLSRKKNESVVINDDIIVSVVEIRGDKVRLGFDAPQQVSVHRREVYDAIKKRDPRLSREPAAADRPLCACGMTLRTADELASGVCKDCLSTGGL